MLWVLAETLLVSAHKNMLNGKLEKIILLLSSDIPTYITKKTKQKKKKKKKKSKTRLYNFDHLNPHFYIVKLGFTGVYIIFLSFAENINCWYLLEPPR